VSVSLSHQILIKVAAIALNQCNWKMSLRVPCPRAFDGADYSGTIVRVGKSAAVDYGWKIGDRMAGAKVASNVREPWAGAFIEYVAEGTDGCWRVPETLSWEEAAATGCAATTSVGMALWIPLKLPGTPETPTLKSSTFLLWRCYSKWHFCDPIVEVVSQHILKAHISSPYLILRSSYKAITTRSPRNFKLVESFDAEKAFDYRSPTCGEDMRAYANNTLEYVLDIITEARTIHHCYTAIGRGGARYVDFELLPDELIATMRKTAKAGWVLGLEMTEREINLPGRYYRKENPDLEVWGREWIKRLEVIFTAGKLRPHPVSANPGGLAKVIDGIRAMQRKEVSGQKMVYLSYTRQ
jgi:NADPH:quinone reductase-like Zn-dependent oxidoreductase